MNKTGIEWCDYSWNPITGCNNGCTWCYAREMTNRFKDKYPNGFKPTFWPGRIHKPKDKKKPARIFTISMGDAFSPGADPDWFNQVVTVIRECPRHTFIVLTKRPDRIPDEEYPDNLWLGVSVTGERDLWRMDELLKPGISAPIKFVSVEPYLSRIDSIETLDPLSWIIIGGLTGMQPFQPPREWVDPIINRAREQGKPVFLKDNLGWDAKIHEWPGVSA